MIDRRRLGEYVQRHMNKKDNSICNLERIKRYEDAIQAGITDQLGGCWWEHTGLDPFRLMFLEGYSADKTIDLIAADINARALA